MTITMLHMLFSIGGFYVWNTHLAQISGNMCFKTNNVKLKFNLDIWGIFKFDITNVILIGLPIIGKYMWNASLVQLSCYS